MYLGDVVKTYHRNSFGTYKARRRDLLMGRCGYVLLRRIGDVPLKSHLVFYLRLIWDVLETYSCYASLRRRHDVPIRLRGEVPLRRLGNVPSRRRWVFHLRRTCDVAGRYRETSLRRRHNVVLSGGQYLHFYVISKLIIKQNSAKYKMM